MIGMTDLTLVNAKESRGDGHWSHDDYDVRLSDANGRVVGKIFKAVMAPDGLNWLWTITERTPPKLTYRGYAERSRKQWRLLRELGRQPMRQAGDGIDSPFKL